DDARHRRLVPTQLGSDRPPEALGGRDLDLAVGGGGTGGGSRPARCRSDGDEQQSGAGGGTEVPRSGDRRPSFRSGYWKSFRIAQCNPKASPLQLQLAHAPALTRRADGRLPSCSPRGYERRAARPPVTGPVARTAEPSPPTPT